MGEGKDCPRTSDWVASIDAANLKRRDLPRKLKSALASGLRLRRETPRRRRRSRS